MTYQGRDPEREARRAGESPGDYRRAGSGSSAQSAGAHASDADLGEFVLGADGQPLRDRYGRPVRRRPQSSQAGRPAARSAEPYRGRPAASRREETRFDVDAYMAQNPPRQQPRPYADRTAQPPRSYNPDAPRRVSRRRAEGRPHSRRKKVNPLKQVFGCAGWLVAIALVFTVVFTLWTDSRLTLSLIHI